MQIMLTKYAAEDCGDDAGDTPMPGDGCTGPVGDNGWNLAGEGQFQCPLLDFFGSVSGGECLDGAQVCDGVIDCLNYLGPFSGAHDEGVVCEDNSGGGDDVCVNDDSTSDAYGDTCSSWYDDFESPGSSGCTGAYSMMMILLLQNSVVHAAEDLKVLHLMMCSHIDIVVTVALNQI